MDRINLSPLFPSVGFSTNKETEGNKTGAHPELEVRATAGRDLTGEDSRRRTRGGSKISRPFKPVSYVHCNSR